MGTNTLTTRSDGQVITQDWFNDFNQAIALDWLPRNASYVPTNLAGSIGSASFSWLVGYFQSLVVNGTTLDTSVLSSLPNRIITCKVTAEDYPDYLTAGGTSNLNVTFDATGTDFVAVINNENTTLTADTIIPVTAGYTTNHTMLINEASWTAASAQEQLSLVFGENAHESVIINFDTAGSNITGLGVGAKAFFRGVNTSAAVEHIYGEIISISGGAVTLRVLKRAVKAGESRIKFRDNDTWTLCKATFLFIDENGSASTTNVHPIKVDTLPSPATAGLYINRISDDSWWYDDGSNPLTAVARLFIGVALSYNATDNQAVCYLPEWRHYKAAYLGMTKSDVKITIGIDPVSTSKGLKISGSIKLGSQTTYYDEKRINTATAGDLESGTSDIGAIGIKYIYRVYSTGKLVFSDIQPREWAEGVLIHPYKMWRCVGYFPHSASAFYPFVTDERGNIVLNSGVDISTSLTTSLANYPLNSGYWPSFCRAIRFYMSTTRPGNSYFQTTLGGYTSSTTFNVAGGVSNPTDIVGLFPFLPVYSGYVRACFDTTAFLTQTDFWIAGYVI